VGSCMHGHPCIVSVYIRMLLYRMSMGRAIRPRVWEWRQVGTGEMVGPWENSDADAGLLRMRLPYRCAAGCSLFDITVTARDHHVFDKSISTTLFTRHLVEIVSTE